ncbi:hypothetical protein E2C01_097817 [Portunus trituberculatus]|uniref:Uncharacterized protein n=1 Tax=Portunus trituberculatus TaxID=210409 RepID=A0A5B7K6M0_PORTR|nr:hypothetical protein [Portunus trituberculatus]
MPQPAAQQIKQQKAAPSVCEARHSPHLTLVNEPPNYTTTLTGLGSCPHQGARTLTHTRHTHDRPGTHLNTPEHCRAS